MTEEELETYLSKKGAVLVSKISSKQSKIKFLKTGWETTVYNANIKRGEFRDRLVPSICGVGFGVMRGDSIKASYSTWLNMINRCYSYDSVTKYITYADCSVCELWLDFREFDKWYEATNPKDPNLKVELDKDIKIKSTRVYSPATCVWIPKKLNQYINNVKGAESLTGIKGVSPAFNKKGIIEGLYEVRCADGKGKRAFLGQVSCVKEGAKIYVEYKESRLKYLAREYFNDDKISEETYKIICNFKVGE